MLVKLVALQAPIIAGIFSIAGVLMTRSVSESRVVVARQTLFASLYPVRVEWLDSFLGAVEDWDREMGQAFSETNETYDPVPLKKIDELIARSRTLFGTEVVIAANEIKEKWEVVKGARKLAVSGGSEAADQVGRTRHDAYQHHHELHRVCRPYLYVGDIRNYSKEAKPARRMIGFTSVRRSRGT